MKKGLFYSTAVLSALAMASCSKDNVTNVTPSENNGASQVIEIAVDNGGDGLTTRAGRPLFSSEAKQTIQNVTVVVCNASDNTVVAKFDEDDWQNESETYNDASGHGRKIRFTFGGDGNPAELTKNTEYKVYAFGYHNASQYTANDGSSDKELGAYFDALTTTTTFNENLTIKNTEATSSYHNAEEIFAGSTTITVDENGNFSKGMTLHRQVAGIYAYVKNIPYFSNAKYLNLYAVKENPNMVLGSFYNAILGANGTVTSGSPTNTQMNVINGTGSSSDSKTLVTRIKLDDWFTEIQDVNNDGIIDRYEYKKGTDTGGNEILEEDKEETPIWKNPYTDKGVHFVKGSAFAGEFIIPFQKGATQTFVLELTNVGGDVLRSWNINLPSSDVNAINGKELITWSGTQWTTGNNASGETQSTYSVLRNHLYSVGTKSTENPSEGTDPEDPTPDTEDPADLATKQDLMLQVNDNWELIHNMEID